MIKIFNLKFVVFLALCLYSTVLSAQINSTTAVVPFGANPSYGNGIMPTNLPTGGTYGRSQDAADAYNEWKSNYTEPCSGGMIRVKFDEPDRTVSEGIGYGMQLAAYAADKALFDGLYRYWKNFVTPATSGKTGKLMNWRIQGCGPSVSGTGSAADADVDAAWALLIAENQWPTATTPFDYASEATNMLFSIRELEINSAGHLINGDGWGFGDNCRNPGYQSPAYYKFFATAYTAHTGAWNTAVTGGYTMINANADGTTGLISDWSNPSGQRNTCNPGGLGYAATDGYGYDACRNPWRMAQDVIWNNDTRAAALCNKIANYVSGRGAGNVGGPLYQNGGNYAGYSRNATFVSTFAMAVMGSASTNQTLMNAMYTQTKNTKDFIPNPIRTLSGYFGNTLRCVSLFMMSGNYWKPGTTSIQEINVRQGALNYLNASTYDFQNQQTTPPAATGKSVTFTIENLGFTTLNLTGTPNKVVLGGTNANQFSVTQPAANSLALAATSTFVVTFTPTTTGAKTATLTIASNDPDEPSYVINLTGTGTPNATAPTMTVYDTVNVLSSGATFPMGAFTVGATGSKVLKITNTGDAPLNINTASFLPAAGPFSIVTPVLPLTIPIGGKGYLTIGYNAPATPTTSSSTVTFATTDPNATAFVLTVTASSAACSANPPNKMMLDYDGNINLKLAFTPTGAFSPIAANPAPGALNISPTVASYVRGTVGNYDIIRYYNCGTVAAATHAGSTYVPFAISASNPAIQVLVYSPAVGIQITCAPQKPDPATTTDWLPLIGDYSSNISVTTTKANQWELLTFDMSKIITQGVTADFKCLDFQIDPLRAYSSLAANSAAAARTFYLDEIKYGINPCVNDLSGVLQDFDAHMNVSLDYAVGALSAPVVNPVPGGINTSANVGMFTKTIATPTYNDGFRYNGCSNKINLQTKKYISMLVYSPVANASIQMSAKIPDGAADADAFPDDAASNTQLTVFANKWHRIYFDLSGVSATDLPNVTSIDIFFDPLDASAVTAPNNKFYFDDIRLETSLPCVAGIPATDILNDFEDNRYMGVVFPGVAGFNTIKANPSVTGINTSAIVGEFIRGTLATGTSVRFAACQGQLDLAAGHNIIEMKMRSPNAGVAVTLSLKATDGTTTLINVTDTVKLANTWTNLRFDVTNLLNSTEVAFIDVIVDANAVFSGTGSTVAARTYQFDDLKYAAASPEINVKALTVPTTDIPNKGSLALGTAVIGDSTAAINFSIQNNGLQTLTLSGTPILVKGGANPADFVVTTSPTFSSSIGAFGATGFTVMFKPQGTLAGPRSASITITSNDANEGTYVIYLNANATAAKIVVLDGGVATSPVVGNNNLTPINVGSATAGTPAPAYTFSVRNTGTGPLDIKTFVTSTGFVASALTPVSPIAAGALSTFTIIGTPALPGINTGTITITSNDPAVPTYVVNITVTGSMPVINVQDAALVTVANNNTTAVSIGTSPVGTQSAAYTFTLNNTGSSPLTITSVTPTTGFTVTPVTPTGSIAALGSATFTVRGTPAAAGLNTGSITIVSNDPATPSYKVNITVTGTVPALQVLNTTTVLVNNATPAISVGTATVGSPATAYTSLSIKNNGLAPLTFTSITASTGFAVTAVTPAAPTTIAAGASATFTVTGTPAVVGANTGTITIVTNDPTTPSFVVNVSVTGTVAATPALQVLNTTTVLINNATPAISVGSAVTGSPATAFTSFSIKNNGNAALTFTSITGSAGFAISAVTPAAPTTIAAGTSATFTVIGTPAALGANTGTITIVTNDPTTPSFVVNVTVTGTAAPVPALQVLNTTTVLVNNATPAISVGTANIGTPAPAFTSFSIKNNGAAALTFTSITGSTGFAISAVSPAAPTTIAAGASATFTVTGTPAAAGANTGTITIVTNDPTTPSFVVNVSVTGTAVPALQVLNTTTVLVNNATPAISVGSAVVGSPATAYTSLSIKNNGTAALTFTSITTSAGFVISAVTPAAPTTIAAGASATFTVTGTPAVLGANTGTITIVTNDPTTPSFVVNVSVTGIAASTPAVQVLNTTAIVSANNTPAISVGSAPVGTPAAAFTSFSIKNAGTAALTFTSITGSAGFVISAVTPAAPTTIALGASATFTVTATPAAAGINNGTITIVTNDPTTPSFVVNVTVTGTVPALQVLNATTVLVNNATPAISVGTATVGSPATAYTSLSIKNNGLAPLTFTSITASTGFAVTAVTPAAPTTIAAGASATFTVTGTPAVVGANTGTITIVTNDPTTPSFVVNVSVTGTPVPVPALQVLNSTTLVANNNTPGILVGSAVTGSPATAFTSFSIKNNGTAALTFTSITGSSGFAISAVTPAAPTTIAAGASATFTVIGTPAVTGSNPGTITIVTNDPTTASFVLNVTVTGTAAPTPTLQVLNATANVSNNNAPAISVGTAVVGAPATIYSSLSIKNTGAAPLTFTSITGSTGFVVSAVTPAAPTTIAVGASATFKVTGTPALVGANPGTITIVTNDPTTASFVVNVSVTGTGAPTPTLQVLNATANVSNNNAPAISVGTAVVGAPATIYSSLSIKNTGAAPLTFTSITGSTGFVVSAVTPAAPTTIAVGASATFKVTGTPALVGANPGTITIVTNDPTNPSFVVNVSVTGTAAPIPTVTIPGVTNNNPTPIQIGNAVVNNPTAPKTFTIQNTGSVPLNVSSISSSNPDFVVSSLTPNPIPANGTGTFTVVATPSAVGTSTGAITINSNDPNSPFVINVAATGTVIPAGGVLQLMDTYDVILANGSSFVVGSNTGGKPTKPYLFTINNIGSSNLVITTIAASTGFNAIPPATLTIEPGGFQTFTVTGTPGTTGTLTILTNDASSPFILNISANVGTPTGVATALASTAIELFPNPTTNNSNLEFNGSFDNVIVTVYSADGSKAMVENFDSVIETSRQINVQDLPAGVYFVEVSTTQGKLVKRLIKQ